MNYRTFADAISVVDCCVKLTESSALRAFQFVGRNRTKRAFGLVTLEHAVQSCANPSRE
jgi:hypothetical protein